MSVLEYLKLKVNKALDPRRSTRLVFPGWASHPVSLSLLLAFFFVATMSYTFKEPAPPPVTPAPSAGIAMSAQDPTLAITETPGPVLIQPTPIPLEWQQNRELTPGIILGGVIMVLIVIGGAISAMRSSRRK